MVETSFWTHQNDFHPIVANENIRSTRVDSARVAIVPQETTPFRIVFDFAPKLDLPTRITYQPIVRNGSEIFRIVGCGQVFGLQQAIENGTASLGDRDEQGRPLLYVCWSETASPPLTKDLPENSMQPWAQILKCVTFWSDMTPMWTSL
jgi:hypothetical protein